MTSPLPNLVYEIRPRMVTILLAKFQVRTPPGSAFSKSTYDVIMTSPVPNLVHKILILAR